MKNTGAVTLFRTGAIYLFVLLACQVARGTVLTFDIDGAQNYMVLSQNYGDRVTQDFSDGFHYGLEGGITPNITLSYQSVTLWSTGFHQLVWVANNETDGDSGFSITMMADDGYAVALRGFDLGNYAATMQLPGVTIKNESGAVLFERINLQLPATNQPHLDIDFPETIVGKVLTISINTTGLGGISDNVGLDNICFSQVERGNKFDINNDCSINYIDLEIMAQQWLSSPQSVLSADLNYDGYVNIRDFGILAANWLTTPQGCE